jgi:hypothetical protein
MICLWAKRAVQAYREADREVLPVKLKIDDRT